MPIYLSSLCRVQGANALNGAYTYGMPAITAWCGFMHALQLKIATVRIKGICPIIHDLTVHGAQDKYGITSFVQKRTPTKRNGAPSPIVQEAYCDFTATIALDIELTSEQSDNRILVAHDIATAMQSLRICGGEHGRCPYSIIVDEVDFDFLSPGDALSFESRVDCVEQVIAHYARHTLYDEDKNGTYKWVMTDKDTGALISATGYKRLGKLMLPGEMELTRSTKHKACYVESTYSVCRLVDPTKPESLTGLFWRPSYSDGAYHCVNY